MSPMSPNMSPTPSPIDADAVTDAVAEGADPVTERVEPTQTAEHHAHEHHVHDPGATEVARGVRLVGATALPVRHPLRADHHLADVGLGPGADALGVQRAGRDVARCPAGGGPGDVGDREPVARVEEARGPAGRQRLARDPGADAGHRVATVLEDLGDVPDVVGLRDPLAGGLRGLVGVERPLVVGVGAGVELAAGEVQVEGLELLAEGGDVLEGQLLDRLELGLPPGELTLLAPPVGHDDGHHHSGEHEQDHEAFHGFRIRTRG